MDLFNAITANLMATLAGCMVMLCLLGRPLTRHHWGFALGSGFFLGAALTALASWVNQWTPWPDSPLPAALVLLMTTWAAGWLLVRRGGPTQLPMPHPPNPGVAARAAWWILLLALLANGFLMAGELLTRPIYPWDAWSAWSVKPKVWIELGVKVDFVSFEQWLASSDVTHFTNEAWSYPELIPRFQLWIIQWRGAWDDHIALTPWLFVGAAIPLVAYHLLRLLSVGPLAAMCVTFLIATLPILSVHIALAGLADIWIAALVLLYCACTLLWLHHSSRRWLGAGLLFLAIAAATKLEGVVWAMILLPVILFAGRPRVLLGVLLVTVVTIATWWLSGGFAFQLLGQDFVLTPREINLPYVGRFAFEFDNQLGSFVLSFLSLPNWHLTWYLLIPAVVWAVYRSRLNALGRGLAGFTALALCFMFVLFFMTPAAMWAESMTASNRLALHFVPACVMWAGLLITRELQDPPGHGDAA